MPKLLLGRLVLRCPLRPAWVPICCEALVRKSCPRFVRGVSRFRKLGIFSRQVSLRLVDAPAGQMPDSGTPLTRLRPQT